MKDIKSYQISNKVLLYSCSKAITNKETKNWTEKYKPNKWKEMYKSIQNKYGTTIEFSKVFGLTIISIAIHKMLIHISTIMI